MVIRAESAMLPPADWSAGRPAQMDEIAVLQVIIVEHEKHAFTVMTFMSIVIGGLATLAISMRTKLDPLYILYIGLVAVVTFAVWTLSHRALSDRAIERAKAFEKSLNGDLTYDGYRVSTHMTQRKWSDWTSAFKHSNFWIPISTALAVVIGIYVLARITADDGIGGGLNGVVRGALESQLTVRSSIDANQNVATVSAEILHQTCNLHLAKADNSSKWSVTKIACTLDKLPATTDSLANTDEPSVNTVSGAGTQPTEEAAGTSDASRGIAAPTASVTRTAK